MERPRRVIAVLLGLPVFAGAVISADAMFLPDRLPGSRRRRRTDVPVLATPDAVRDVPSSGVTRSRGSHSQSFCLNVTYSAADSVTMRELETMNPAGCPKPG